MPVWRVVCGFGLGLRWRDFCHSLSPYMYLSTHVKLAYMPEWKSDLFDVADCWDNRCNLCCRAIWCHPCLTGQTKEALQNTTEPLDPSIVGIGDCQYCGLQCLLGCICDLPCIMPCILRGEIQDHRKISGGNACNNFLLSCLCTPCVVRQNAREMLEPLSPTAVFNFPPVETQQAPLKL